jgi:hypothetical protein
MTTTNLERRGKSANTKTVPRALGWFDRLKRLTEFRTHYVTSQKQAARLANRLIKFCSPETPEPIRKRGERWGGGQVELTINGNETFRAQISEVSEGLQFPIDKSQGDPELLSIVERAKLALPTAAGLEIHLALDWCARKQQADKFERFQQMRETWRWELLPLTTTLNCIVIHVFWQNKAHRRQGVLYPKRLFFRTAQGEPGSFSQRSDPENLNRSGSDITDPLLKE